MTGSKKRVKTSINLANLSVINQASVCKAEMHAFICEMSSIMAGFTPQRATCRETSIIHLKCTLPATICDKERYILVLKTKNKV
jgi:hypothetical protein